MSSESGIGMLALSTDITIGNDYEKEAVVCSSLNENAMKMTVMVNDKYIEIVVYSIVITGKCWCGPMGKVKRPLYCREGASLEMRIVSGRVTQCDPRFMERN